jgi:hypothetical protein
MAGCINITEQRNNTLSPSSHTTCACLDFDLQRGNARQARSVPMRLGAHFAVGPPNRQPPTEFRLWRAAVERFYYSHHLELQRQVRSLSTTPTLKMAAKNLPAAFNATSQDIEMLLSAQCHLGSKNMQVHMEPYLWKTRADGINVLNVGKTWYVALESMRGDDASGIGTKAAA